MISDHAFKTRQRGLSLIELMIAVSIGLVVIGAVSGVFLSSSRNYTQDELLSRMQENARYALHVLAEDLSMMSYWGPLISGNDINTAVRTCSATPTAPECEGMFENSELTPGADCNPGTVSANPWSIHIDDPIEYSKEVASGTAATAAFGCIDDTEFLADTDILVVKRVEGQELDSDRDDLNDPGHVYLRTDGTDAMLFEYDPDLNNSEGPGIKDWRYRANVYYIRDHFLDAADGIPTLARQNLRGDTMESEGGGVAQGIEYFHVMFGIDTTGDATANYYTSEPDPDEMSNATSARIYVLARSAAPDPNYDNNKIYELGDVTKDFSGVPDDHFYRRVFTTTVALRNQRNRIRTTGN